MHDAISYQNNVFSLSVKSLNVTLNKELVDAVQLSRKNALKNYIAQTSKKTTTNAKTFVIKNYRMKCTFQKVFQSFFRNVSKVFRVIWNKNYMGTC